MNNTYNITTNSLVDSCGKQYFGEKAVISLTSWIKRIPTVGKTLYALWKTCPGFHIVLNLTTVEFPNKVNDLPKDLQLMLSHNMFEILWIKNDYKVLMKTLFAIDRYRDVPVISADDDNYPRFNYPEELYNEWLKDKTYFISYWGRPYNNTMHLGGNFTITPPYVYGKYGINCLCPEIVATREDDPYYTVLRDRLHLNHCKLIDRKVSEVIAYHDSVEPLVNVYRNRPKDWAMHEIERYIQL